MKDALLCAEIENEPIYKQKKRFPKNDSRHSMDPVVPANYCLRRMRYCVGWFCDEIKDISFSSAIRKWLHDTIFNSMNINHSFLVVDANGVKHFLFDSNALFQS